jgi:undecaprenyl-diphosphatase
MDNRAFSFMAPFINDTNTAIVNFITFFGSHEFLIPANLLLIAYYLIKKHRWYSIRVPAIAVSSFVLMFGLKRFFGRQRPSDQLLEQATNFSFPSGHALMSITFYGLLAYIGWHSIKNSTIKWVTIIFLLVWILAIGASRIYLRKHYYSDVIAGLALGFLWLVVSLIVIRLIEKRSKQKLNRVVEQAPEPVADHPNA